MKGKIIQLLLSTLFWVSLLFLSGDLKKIMEKLKQKLPENNGDVIVSGVRFNDDGNDQRLIFSIENQTTDELVYSSAYDLYVLNGSQPTLLSEKVSEYVDQTDYIPSGASKEITVVITDRFDRLCVGSYRCRKTFGVLVKEIDFTVVS